MSNPFRLGPIADYRNPPIHPEWYSPKYAVLQQITPLSSSRTQITTEESNEFVQGQIVRFIIPFGDGMDGLNEREAYVVSILSETEFIADIDTRNFNAFNPTRNPIQTPYVVPVGDINTGAINSSGRTNNILYIEGSFINISPQ